MTTVVCSLRERVNDAYGKGTCYINLCAQRKNPQRAPGERVNCKAKRVLISAERDDYIDASQGAGHEYQPDEVSE